MRWSKLSGVLMAGSLTASCELAVTFQDVPLGAGGSGGDTTSTTGGGDTGGTTTTTTTTPTSDTGGTGGTTSTGGGGTTTTGSGGASLCGNMMVEAGEECDDANDVEGDGCFKCQLDCGCAGCTIGKACPDCGPAAGAVTYEDAGTKHCYLFIPTASQREPARSSCQLWGGDLAAPSTVAEMTKVIAPEIITVFAAGDVNARCWTGGNDIATEGVYQWANGEPWNLPPAGPAWEVNEPDGVGFNCILIGANGTIRDRECTFLAPFLCERPPPPPPP
jgi:hypothetical protein